MSHEVPPISTTTYSPDTGVSGPEGRSVEADVSRHLDPALDGQERPNGAAAAFFTMQLNAGDDPSEHHFIPRHNDKC